MLREFVANKVYELRSAHGATQEDLGRAVDVSRQTIIAIEKGHYTPSVLLAVKIAKFFKCSVEEIFVIKHE